MTTLYTKNCSSNFTILMRCQCRAAPKQQNDFSVAVKIIVVVIVACNTTIRNIVNLEE